MKIYDITQELFSSEVYPGDISPSFKRVSDMSRGDCCNITEIEMNVHNGTHIDAPRHFIKDGKDVEKLDPEIFFGRCTVKTFESDITYDDIIACGEIERLLIKGNVFLTSDGARALDKTKIKLIGGEQQSISHIEAPMEVHVEVLSRGIVVLEGLVLNGIADGEYWLCALPLKLGGSDGAPVRAVLIELEENS